MSNRRKTFACGFTLVEVLLALAITAMVLTAVAFAFNAAAINYQVNEDIFKAINGARQALFRITTELRTATAVDPCTPNTECGLLTAGGGDITYRYNGTDDKLYLVTNDDLADSDYLLCENVTAMTFSKSTFTEDGQTKVKSVQISMTVTAGDVQKSISAAAVVRRNLD